MFLLTEVFQWCPKVQAISATWAAVGFDVNKYDGNWKGATVDFFRWLSCKTSQDTGHITKS